jgi:hypothetical protein
MRRDMGADKMSVAIVLINSTNAMPGARLLRNKGFAEFERST